MRKGGWRSAMRRSKRASQLEDYLAGLGVSGHRGRDFGGKLGSTDGRVPGVQEWGEHDGEGVEGKVHCKAGVE